MQQTQVVQSPVILRHKPEVCACICTRNSQVTLPRCLDSLAGQHLPADRFSILVVDDGSTDDTADTFREWRDNHPDLTARLVCQPHAGLAATRNAGLQLSDAALVAYVSAEAIAGPGWLTGLLDAFAEFPGAAAVAGQVQPLWPAGRPRRWHRDLAAFLGCFDHGGQPCTLALPHLPSGCNFAVRRNVAVGLGRFRSELGPRKTTLLTGEHTELFLRMLATDYQVAYWPDAAVHLAIPPQRVTREYLLHRAWTHGRSMARLAYACPQIAGRLSNPAASPGAIIPDRRHSPLHLSYWSDVLFDLGFRWQRAAFSQTLFRHHAATHLRRAAAYLF